jgi:GNAT superfamily N-acetyltransferase
MNMEYSISTDKSKLAIEAIHDFLCHRSYWAKGRSLENVIRTIESSVCFGIYDSSEKMLGFARVVTDHIAFAYLMDVFILEEYRGKGLGQALVKHVIEHPDLQVRFWLLGTVNAHDMYKKLGFSELSNVDRYMEIRDATRC